MATFKFNDKNVYYEVHGEGKPILILNGIMMSTLSWQMFLDPLKENNKVILVDFLDQGFSDKLEGEEYTQDLQVELVKALLDELKIEKTNIFGISYGTSVALRFAVKYQNRIERLAVFNGGAYTSPWLEEIGNSWIKAANTNDPSAYFKTTIPPIYSPSFYTNHAEFMKQREQVLKAVFTPEFMQAMNRLTNSAVGYDIRDEIKNILVPTLVVGATKDHLTPLEDQEFLVSQIPYSNLVILPDCGHASMYEKPFMFLTLILGFFNSSFNIKTA